MEPERTDKPTRVDPVDEAPAAKVVCAPRFNGWWAVLAFLPFFLFWLLPRTRSTSGFTVEPKFIAAAWASLAIGIRAAVGIVRRERNWAWMVYLLLYFLLPEVARLTTEYAFRLGWAR